VVACEISNEETRTDPFAIRTHARQNENPNESPAVVLKPLHAFISIRVRVGTHSIVETQALQMITSLTCAALSPPCLKELHHHSERFAPIRFIGKGRGLSGTALDCISCGVVSSDDVNAIPSSADGTSSGGGT